MASCYHCAESLNAYLANKVSRQDSCPKCHRDLRCCRNCEFFDANSHWECREEVSEHVLDKEKSNFCDYFRLGAEGSKAGNTKAADDLRNAAEALFKK